MCPSSHKNKRGKSSPKNTKPLVFGPWGGHRNNTPNVPTCVRVTQEPGAEPCTPVATLETVECVEAGQALPFRSVGLMNMRSSLDASDTLSCSAVHSLYDLTSETLSADSEYYTPI